MINILAKSPSQTLSAGVLILLAILITALAGLFIWLVYRSIQKAKSDILERDKNFEFNGEKFDGMIARKLQNDKKAAFTIFQIELQDIEALQKTYGDAQFTSAVSHLIQGIKDLLNTPYKVFKYSDGTIIVYSKYNIHRDQIKDISKRLIIECQKTIVLAGALTMEMDVNIGIVSCPGGGNNLDEVKQNLLIALVSAKRKGINTYSIFDAQLGNRQTEEYKNYLEIKNAINNKEFILFYQPMVDFNTMEVIGAEALLRWEHKTQGTLSPNSFLNIMEQSGDINWVGFWSFEQLVKQSQTWKAQYPDRKLLLSMNLSPKQLMNADLPEEMRRLIKRYKVTTSDFCMEIVEFALFEKVDTVQENLKKLSQMGFKIAIDNFGLEFSTLQAIEKFKIDIVKLDRKFLNDVLNKEITKSILQMLVKYAEEQNIMIVAEGVENEDVLKHTKSLGVNMGQGYHFARPQKPSEFIQNVILTPWND